MGPFFFNTFGLHHRLSGTVTFGDFYMDLSSETNAVGSLGYEHCPAAETQNPEKNMKTNDDNGTESSKSTNRFILWMTSLAVMVTLGRILGRNH